MSKDLCRVRGTKSSVRHYVFVTEVHLIDHIRGSDLELLDIVLLPCSRFRSYKNRESDKLLSN